MTAPKTLTGRATAAYQAEQRRLAKERKAAEVRAEIVPEDPGVARAAEAWARETLATRTAAAELAARVLDLPADPDAWTVRPTEDNVAHTTREGLAFTVRPLLGFAGGSRIELGVRLVGSSAPLATISSLTDLGIFLAANSPKRRRSK